MTAAIDTERERRLRWRCRRGVLEIEALLLAYLDGRQDDEMAVDFAALEQLLVYSNDKLMAWLLGSAPPSDAALVDVVNEIRRSTGA